MENAILEYNQFVLPALMLFASGLIGAMFKKNLVVVFMCIEMMLCAAALLAMSFSAQYAHADGCVFALLILAVGACEVAVALAVIIQRFKLKQQPFTDELNSKRE